jgi:hypothetical protein
MSTTPDAVERHPAGYAWSQRLHVLEVLDGMEGGAVYTAEGENSFWIVTDEGTLADFLPHDDPTRGELIALARFDDRTRWRAAGGRRPSSNGAESPDPMARQRIPRYVAPAGSVTETMPASTRCRRKSTSASVTSARLLHGPGSKP